MTGQVPFKTMSNHRSLHTLQSDDLGMFTLAEEGPSSKVPWGINLMKKNKKCPPRAFGVRLEDCQPAAENKVRMLSDMDVIHNI